MKHPGGHLKKHKLKADRIGRNTERHQYIFELIRRLMRWCKIVSVFTWTL